MPYLNITCSRTLPPPAVEQLAQTLTQLTTTILEKQRELTAVVVETVPPTSWFIGGKSLIERGSNSFYLDIKITEGTNTKQQKSDYICAVFTAMGQLLGALDTSYITIHDVKADAWGFQGITQEYRFISKQITKGGTQ